MSLEELKSVLGDNELSFGSISSSVLGSIMNFVEVKLSMDVHTFDYYYEIDVDDLLASNLSKELLETLKTQGWSLTEDDKKLILYLT
jgi:hypothetical protein